MQRARHFAAAVNGGGARFSVLNANSNIERGDVTKRRRWLTKDGAISGKLWEMSQRRTAYFVA
jgi:hypothetical protein